MRRIIGSTFAALALVACDYGAYDRLGRTDRGGPDGDGLDAGDPTQPGWCAVGAAHLGFGGDDFVAERAVGGLGVDRRRIKPFSALAGEFQRVLSTSPEALAASSSTFGDVPARWYSEPVAGAVSLVTTYSLAFTACHDSMSDAAHAEVPTMATATTECARLQRTAWQRAPTAEETKACAELAVTTLASEPAPRRRWAHACASVMTSAGFISY